MPMFVVVAGTQPTGPITLTIFSVILPVGAIFDQQFIMTDILESLPVTFPQRDDKEAERLIK